MLISTVPEVELRGMSIQQLMGVYAEIIARCLVEGWTDKDGQLFTPEKCNLYDIKDRLIMKRTESKKCSYVELIATGPQKPTRFVSHWWGEPVFSVIRCLDQHFGDHIVEIDESKFDGVVTFNHTISIAHKTFGLTAMDILTITPEAHITNFQDC